MIRERNLIGFIADDEIFHGRNHNGAFRPYYALLGIKNSRIERRAGGILVIIVGTDVFTLPLFVDASGLFVELANSGP